MHQILFHNQNLKSMMQFKYNMIQYLKTPVFMSMLLKNKSKLFKATGLLTLLESVPGIIILILILTINAASIAAPPPENSLEQFHKSYLPWHAKYKFKKELFHRYFYSSVPGYYGLNDPKTIKFRKQVSSCEERHQQYNNRALLALVQGIDPKAERCFDSALVSNSKDRDIIHNVGLFHANMGNYKLAKRYFDQIVQQPLLASKITSGARKTMPRNMAFNLGLLYSKMGNTSAAIEHYNWAEPFLSDNAAFYYNWGLDNMKLQHYGAALQHFEIAIKLKGKNIDFHLAAANANVALNSLADAKQHFKKALRINPLDPRPSVGLGNVCLALNQPNQAISHFKRILKDIDAKSAEAYTGLGNAYYDKDDLAAALNKYDKAILYDPSYCQAYIGKGKTLLNAGQYDAAITSFNSAVLLAPGNRHAHNGRGVAYFKLGDFYAAAIDFEYADGLDTALSFSHDAYIARGYNAIFMVRYEDAIGYFTKAITIQPYNSEGYSGRAQCLIELNDLQEALADLTKAIKLDSRRVTDRINRGSIYILLEKKTRAKADFRKAVALMPDNVNTNNGMGIVLANEGEFQEALGYFNKALALDSSRADIHNSRAECLSDWGTYLKSQGLADTAKHLFAIALDEVNKAIAWSNAVPIYIVNRGNIKEKMGDHAGAREDYDEVISRADSMVVSSAYNNRGFADALDNNCEAAKKDFETALEWRPGSKAASLNISEQERSCDEKEFALNERWTQYWQRRKLSNKRNRKIRKHNYIQIYWYNLPAEQNTVEEFQLAHDLEYEKTDYTMFYNAYFMYEVEKVTHASNKQAGKIRTTKNKKLKPGAYDDSCPTF